MSWLAEKFANIAQNIKDGKYGQSVHQYEPIKTSEREHLTVHVFEKAGVRRIVCEIVEIERDGDVEHEWFDLDIDAVDTLTDILQQAKNKVA